MRSQLPALGCNSSRSACCGQAQDLASSLILFLAVDIVAGLLTDRGPGACPVGRVLSTELAMDLRSPDLLVQDSLDSGATVFDVAAWLELVNKDEANVGSATMNPRGLMAHRLLR